MTTPKTQTQSPTDPSSLQNMILLKLLISSFYLPPSILFHPRLLTRDPLTLILYHQDATPEVYYQPPPLTLPEAPINEITFTLERRLVSPQVTVPSLRAIPANPYKPPLFCPNICRINTRLLSGCLEPAHLSDLSDLPTLSPVLLCFLKWFLKEWHTFHPSLTIPPELQFLIDPTPILPRLRRVFLLSSTSKKVIAASFSNSIVNFRTLSLMAELDVKVSWERVPALDHRKISLTLCGINHQPSCACPNRGPDGAEEEVCPRAPDELTNAPLMPASMNILYWNCRGIARPSFRTHLSYLINAHNPSIVILSETRVSSPNCLSIVRKLPFDSVELLDPVGFTGGIIILWNGVKTAVPLIKKGEQSINVVVQDSPRLKLGFERRSANRVTDSIARFSLLDTSPSMGCFEKICSDHQGLVGLYFKSLTSSLVISLYL
ncbi:uncharacterized protein LOC141591623 [Silene latifolia]|uniref:uncharacterized protein LOC141591623 n=1 Tax=Silene latifolia TaxID=37657 RepID=UPI003D7739A0